VVPGAVRPVISPFAVTPLITFTPEGAAGFAVDVGAVTCKVNMVLCDRAPDTAVTVMGALPIDADDDVVSFSRLEQLGAQVPDENDAVTPLGTPDTDREMLWATPPSQAAVITVAPVLD